MDQPTTKVEAEAEKLEVVIDAKLLDSFELVKILSESTTTNSIYLLGYFDNSTDGDVPGNSSANSELVMKDSVKEKGNTNRDLAIVHIQRAGISTERFQDVLKGLKGLNTFMENPPYFNAHARFSSTIAAEIPDLVIKLTYPATETHIRKYSAQERVMERETEEVYKKAVVPYMDSFPPSRVEWVYNILDGIKEAERVVHVDNDPETGFVVVPDLKWDQSSVNALYLTVIVRTRSIRSLRDLKPEHIPFLIKIRDTTHQVVQQRFGVESNKLRMFVHYQPSYYHFHVHVVHMHHEGLAGMTVGQSHMLDELISLLELSPPSPAPSILARMTFNYALGVEHKLYPLILAATAEIADEEV